MSYDQHESQRINLETASLGIELGSTRIKAVLIGADHSVLASGAHDWENRLEGRYWTYRLEDALAGIQDSIQILGRQVHEKFGVKLTTVGAIGVSAMMHGYLPFNGEGKLLAPFRTWRNTTTGEAAKQLTELFQYNVPQRWSIAHLYQAMLNGEAHVGEIRFLTTLAGYIHWQLTGQKVLGVGDASGMMPLGGEPPHYDAGMLRKFATLSSAYDWKLEELLPEIRMAGEQAGTLTESGAKLLDPTGTLRAGIPMCPPEGDAGTGMVATNSVRPRTGNVSAGTSVFAMIVLEKALSKVYEEIDMVATPAGDAVAMVHCNTCTTDLDAWVKMLGEMVQASGTTITKPQLYDIFYEKALEGEADCGGLMNINYYSGEPITGVSGGRPLFLRKPDATFTLANFARAQLYSAIATLKLGMDILRNNESVQLDSLLGHGGLFKTPVVGQKILADALNTPVSVMETAGEGGPWGMALLAQYMRRKNGQSLAEYLADEVFAGAKGRKQLPDAEDAAGFERFIANYLRALAAEKAAVSAF
ncbi:MAG TPA: FGGY-family carbohydrate kinase [Candidatus Cryosericum sp.]|nr:FGGY-family carbohydrate kinase [Candidatus Cryosericum sp.]